MEVLCISIIAEDNPIVCRICPEHQNHSPPTSPPPLPPFNNLKRYRSNPKLKLTTCITRISKRIVEDTEQILPDAEPPWRPSEEDLMERVKIFTPGNRLGTSVKEEWANAPRE